MQVSIDMNELSRATKSLPYAEGWHREFGSRVYTVNITTMLADIQISRGEVPSKDGTTPYIQFMFQVENSVRSNASNWYQWVLIDYIRPTEEE